MTKFSFTILLSIISIVCYAQTNTDYSTISLETEADYKNAETSVLEASNYILTTPVDAENLQRIYAIQFILAWMEGTPEYTFSLDVLDKLDDDVNQSTVYVAALAKYSLENKVISEYDKSRTIRNGAFKIFAKYCNESDKQLIQKKKLKKLLKAYNNNTDLNKILD